jgi:hypothetical protein
LELLGWQKSAQSIENKGALLRLFAKVAVGAGWRGGGDRSEEGRCVVPEAIFGCEHGLL